MANSYIWPLFKVQYNTFSDRCFNSVALLDPFFPSMCFPTVSNSQYSFWHVREKGIATLIMVPLYLFPSEPWLEQLNVIYQSFILLFTPVLFLSYFSLPRQHVSHYEMENVFKALFSTSSKLSPKMPNTVESNTIKINLNQTEHCNKGHIICLWFILLFCGQPAFQLMSNQIPSLCTIL